MSKGLRQKDRDTIMAAALLIFLGLVIIAIVVGVT